MSRTVVVDWTKLEGVLRRQMGFAIEMAARYYPKIHEPDNPDDESRQQWVRWLVAYAMNAVTECRTLRSEAQGEGWQVTEPARDIVRREMPETRATVREAIRAARRSEAQGELVKEAVALIDEAVSEIAGDCQCYEEDGEIVVCWTCRAMNWSDRADRQEESSDE